MNQRFFSVAGTDYQRGLEVGKLLRWSIVTNFNNQVDFYAAKPPGEAYNFQNWAEESKDYLPYIQEYCPHCYEELRGMAEGAQLPLKDILALTTAYELAVTGGNVSGKCTGFAVAGEYTKTGGAICGQTNDECVNEWLSDLDVVIKHQNSHGPSSLVYTHPGISSYMGMNDCGLAVLWQYIDDGQRQMGVPTNCILRELLFYQDIDEAISFLEKVPHTIPNNYLLTHKTQGTACVECYPDGVFIQSSKSHTCHTNNILTSEKKNSCDAKDPLVYRQPFSLKTIEEMAEEVIQGRLTGLDGILEWSYLRLHAIKELVEESKGKIDAKTAMDFLSSHRYQPFSICSHNSPLNPTWKTLAAIIFDLEAGKMYIAFGCPCEVQYQEYTI